MVPPPPSEAAAPTSTPSVGAHPEVALVAPVYDEEGNLRNLYERVVEAFAPLPSWELILVDDASKDGSWALMQELARVDPRVRILQHAENRGQSTAIWMGLLHARAEVVATIDADLQQAPEDLLPMLELLEGADAVVGYRARRKDTVVRRLSSRIANRIRNSISQDSIIDTGCSLKVFRREAILTLAPFNGVHRFMPTLMRYQGYKVLEHPVSHADRTAGVSKYGIRNRAMRAFIDLLAVRWMRSRLIYVEGPAAVRLSHRPEESA